MPIALLIISMMIVLVDVIRNPDLFEHMPASERYRQKFMNDC